MLPGIELFSGMSISSVVVKNMVSIAWRSEVGIAYRLSSFNVRLFGLRDFALGWYWDMSFKRS